jgi:nucleotide-binding universal stress UspA family protein
MEGQTMELPKVEINRILYATDLSESARYAFAYAASLTNRYRCKLVLLHVLHENPGLEEQVRSYVSPEHWDRIKEQHLQDVRDTLIGKQRGHLAIRDVLDQFCQQAEKELADCKIEMDEILLERGHPVEQIIRVSEEKNIDLIVMGRHGYGVLRDALMGGVARGVLRRSTKPVLLVKLPDE